MRVLVVFERKIVNGRPEIRSLRAVVKSESDWPDDRLEEAAFRGWHAASFGQRCRPDDGTSACCHYYQCFELQDAEGWGVS